MNAQLQKSLNGYLGNAGVMYIKIHNLHWNVVGAGFKAVHEYLETVYVGFADMIDSVAECIKMQGEFPIASLKEFLEVATIQEIESKEYSIKEALSIVYSDIETLKKQAEEIREIASNEDAYSVVAIMEGDLENYNKTLWFLQSMMK